MCSDKLATPIADFLKYYKDNNFLRCHMPGGKGNTFSSDITEIFGADSLYETSVKGIISESEQNAAALFGGGVCYSCSGTTLSIQAMLAFLKKSAGGRNKIIAGRYSHRSLISSAILLDLEIEWVYPEKYLSAEISPDVLRKAISGTSENACMVFLTAIDYYGGECDIAAAVEVCRSANNLTELFKKKFVSGNSRSVNCRAPALLIDNAHGAYKVFRGEPQADLHLNGALSKSYHPIKLGADFVADSAHKTLPVLTGGGYLHIKNLKPDNLFEIKKQMALFGTTSPSYLILESLDLCNLHIKNEKHLALQSFELVRELKDKLSGIGFKVLKSDALRITINARECGYTGFQLAERLRENRLECEMCDDTYVVLLFSTITGEQQIKGAEEIFRRIKIKKRLPVQEHILLKPKVALPPSKAYFEKQERVSIKNAFGRICAEIIAPCPPGIPLVMPGEVIDRDCIEELMRYGAKEVAVII